jgi:hypothetical protein
LQVNAATTLVDGAAADKSSTNWMAMLDDERAATVQD